MNIRTIEHKHANTITAVVASALASLFISALIFYGCFIVSLICFRVPSGYYQYKATLNDSVGVNEFLNTYNIIECEDGIYTFELKGIESELWRATTE